MKYEPVIGLEVHSQLNTRSKIFCGCSTEFGAAANTQTCPICLGMPGVLPVLNKDVVAKAIRAALASGFAKVRVRIGAALTRAGYAEPAAQALAALIVAAYEGGLLQARQVARPMDRRALFQRGGNLLDNDMQHDSSPFRLVRQPV